MPQKGKPLNPLLQRMLAQKPDPAPAFDFAAVFQLAAQAHKAGKLDEAEAGYRRILAHEPQHADALYLLGAVQQQRGNRADAEKLYRQALSAREDARFLFALAGLLHEMRRHPEAEGAFRHTLELAPGLADAHNNYGNLLAEIGRVDDAESAFRRAIATRPDFAFAHNNLANLLKGARRLDEAEAAYRRTLELDPGHLPARLNLAAILVEADRMDEAEQAYRQAIALHPQSPDAHNNFGNMLYRIDRGSEAEQAFRRALALRPAFPQALNNLGNMLRESGRVGDAITAYRQAIALAPDFVDAFNNLGTALKEDGQAEAAMESYHRALALAPGNADAHLNLAHILLADGDLAAGWREYEYRWHAAGRAGPPAFAAPMWDGTSDLQGKTIYLHAEQGFGDTLQFMRYMPLVAERGATVLLGVPPELKALAASCPGVTTILTTGDATPAFDFHCPLMSLPPAFGTVLQTIPGKTPYLAASEQAVAAWREKLGAKTTVRIGLAWAGKPRKQIVEAYNMDKQRSMALAQLLPLLDTPGAAFYSLQLGEAARQAEGNTKLIDLTGELRDFHDSAALIANLDLVIAVDTAVAHLAGALGKPVWLLNRYHTCWRWLRERADSPWYPSMRIFRQTSPGDWGSVVQAVRGALEQDLRNNRLS